MHKFPLVALLVLCLPYPSIAQYRSTCSRDLFGTVSCRDQNGGRLEMDRDIFGDLNSTFTDGHGNRTRCTSSRDIFGDVTTTCY